MSLSLTIKIALLAVLVLVLLAGAAIALAQRFLRRRVERLAEGVSSALRPEAIHLEPLRRVEWRQPRAVSRLVQGFRKLGFRAIGNFGIAEMPGVQLVALGHPDDRIGAVVYDAAGAGVSCELIARYRNGGTLTVSTATADASPPRPGHEKIFLHRGTPPKRLCRALFDHLVSEDLLDVHPGNFARVFETTWAEESAWRKEHERPREAILRDPELDALSEALFQRLKMRDLAGVQEFLDLGFSPEGRDARGYTPLMVAVTTGNLALVDALLAASADPNARAPGIPGMPAIGATEMLARAQAEVTSSGQTDAGGLLAGLGKLANALGTEDEALVTPLTLAIETGVPEVVAALLRAGANLEGPGDPPLHFAAQEGDIDMVRAIVEAGADVDRRDDEGMTPLHRAAVEGHAEVVEYLVSAGADVNARFGKETPIQLAAAAGAVDVVELLELYVGPRRAKRARKILRDAEPMGDVRARRLLDAAMNGRAPMVRKLLAAGVRPDALESEDGDGTTALMLATQGGHVEAMRALIEAGADVNRENEIGDRVIARALETRLMEDASQQPEAIRLLVRHGADCSRLDPEDREEVERFVNE